MPINAQAKTILPLGARAESSAPAHPMRVLMVLESDFSPERGLAGAEAQVRTIATQLIRLGHQVTVVTPLLANGSQQTATRLEQIAIARVRYPRRRIVGGLVMNARFAAFLWQRRDRYDVWHVHIGHNFAAITCAFGAVLGKPVILKISGWWELEKGLLAPKVGPLGRIARACLKQASATQAISSRIARELERCGFPRERIVNLANAVDLTRFPMRVPRRTRDLPFTAVFVGRLVVEKDLPTLFEAWAKAFGSRKDVRLKVIGQGACEAQLRADAKRLGIEHSVEFFGHSHKVEEALTDVHVGVLPSRIEGLSNVLLELMSCGLPTIASKVSGSEDFVITGENGWLFPVSDVASLAAALREAEALSPSRLAEMGRAARATVEARASLELVVDKLLSLYARR